jgi:hypothetical protein
MTQKQKYLTALDQFDSAWILKSAEHPNKYMSKTQVLLHYIVLRNRGAICTQ